MYKKLLFGTAGIPSSAKGTTVDGVKRIPQIGLDAMELEFVYSTNLNEITAQEVKKVAFGLGVELTCHGSFFINLNSRDEKKFLASKKRILDGAKIAYLAGAKSFTFHPAFYLGDDKKLVYEKVKINLEEIISELKQQNNSILIRPETTGKATQFGSIDEIYSLSSELDQVLPCIDFAHLHARTNGSYNTYDEFHLLLEKGEKILGKGFLKNLHCHVAGIDYGEKGERKHLFLKDSDLNYLGLLKALKEFNCAGVVICESPNPEKDAILLKEEFEKI